MLEQNQQLTDIEANVLALLETLEAEQINLGLYTTYISSKSLYEMRKRNKECASLGKEEIESILSNLVRMEEVIEWEKGYFRSRIAETVRILRLVRQRLWSQKDIAEAPLIVEDIRVEFRQRYRPNWKAVKVPELLSKLSPYLSETLQQSFRKAIRFDTMSRFQAESLLQLYHHARTRNAEQKSFVIAGDTGAGKTEAFLFPILLDIASETSEDRALPGVRAIIVYPRIRLARNQLGRVLRYTSRLHQFGGPRITIGIQNGDIPKHGSALSEKWAESEVRDGKRWYKVGLLESCASEHCEKGAYWVSEDDPELDRGYPELVCDACNHKVTTLAITQKALEVIAPDILLITDVSLSQWLAREKYSHLWGLWEGDTITLAPRFLVLDEVHLYEQLKGAHVSRLIKRVQARTRLASMQAGRQQHLLVIGVSATLRDEKRFLAKLLDVNPQSANAYSKLMVVKPVRDDLDPTKGRERYIFVYPRSLSPTVKNTQYRVNDQAAAIQIIMAVMHNLKSKVEWRGVAFFDSINDLRQFRHNYDKDSTMKDWVTDEAIDPSGRRSEIPPANQDELWRIRTDGYKLLNDNKRRSLAISNRCSESCERRLREHTLSECRHFQNGDCWIWAQRGGWNEQLRVANPVYAGSSSELDGQDLIPASPSLEVGYDDEAIQLVYQHKAPSNAASFIQRRGRAGRNPEDSPVIVTLLWPYRRDDAFYFFHPEALYDPVFDDVPLNASNFNVQRTHTLLAFFDLLACLRRQNCYGLRDDGRVIDFTDAGWQDLVLNTIQDFKELDDPKRPGQKRFVIKKLETKETVWVSGKPVAQKMIHSALGKLIIKGWLAMNKGLTSRVLLPAWEKLHESDQDLVQRYLDLSYVAGEAFKEHPMYPFLVPSGASLPDRFLSQFGNERWHSNDDSVERSNWLKTYRHIDWMLQGKDEVTTLIVHYQGLASQSPSELEEQNVEVTYALNELLPGNVSYRLRDKGAIHWTPIPRVGESTFLYPEKAIEVEGEIVGTALDENYVPKNGDLTGKPNSIFGVPRYLDKQFPGLPFIELKRLRVERFGLPDKQYSPDWVFVPDQDDPQEGYSALRSQLNAEERKRALTTSRRSSARANSVIIPHVPGSRKYTQKQLNPPLETLFAAIDGYLEGGYATLGYTRVFYEMQIDLKTDKHEENRTLHRQFYPASPILDEADKPKPVLVGYTINTQGIRFQVNPDMINRTVAAIFKDDELRFRIRRNFAVYSMASYATKWGVFIKTHLDYVAVAVDYWLHAVVPMCLEEPRLLNSETDFDALLAYYKGNQIVIQAEVDDFASYLRDHESFFPSLNETLLIAFKDTQKFFEFVSSIVLHSLSSLLKTLIARLGGVSSDKLVAYADLPILEHIDASIDPRILIMDTIEGGSGGVAQAFERLDVTDNEGSLWWMLQRELGYCPIGIGEALIQTVLSLASERQIQTMQNKKNITHEDWLQFCSDLGMKKPEYEALPVLSRVLLKSTEINGRVINPALILRELFAFQRIENAQSVCALSRESVVCRVVSSLNGEQYPHIAELKSALEEGGTVSPTELNKELALQLLALYEQACQDGCPVCLSVTSDIEHYYLASYLNSRQALSKLNQELAASSPKYPCLTALEPEIREGQTFQVEANPGSLGNRLNTDLGIGIITQTDEQGQIQGSTATIINAERAKNFIIDGSWNKVDKTKTLITSGGQQVRSKAEYVIATMLEAQDYEYVYEPKLNYCDEEGIERCVHPNFYLSDYDLYIEYWGRSEAEYIEARSVKEQIYKYLVEEKELRIVLLEQTDVQRGTFLSKISEFIENM